MKKQVLWLAGCVLLAAASVASIVGCATADEEYFIETESKANVFVAPIPCAISKVAVMPFKAPTELIGSSVSDMFVTEMLRAGRYELVERSQMSKVLNEAELSLSGLSVAKATEIGTMLGADGVIIGTVDEYSTVAYRGASFPVVGITVRLIDCKTGKVMWSVDLAKRADDKSTTLSEHARVVVHEMTAGLYQKWDVQEKIDRPVETASSAEEAPDAPVGAPAAVEEPPKTPAGVSLSDMGLREVVITWDEAAADAYQYKIERGAAADGPFTLLTKVPASRGKYVDGEDLSDNTVYYYRVTAVSDKGLESAPTEVKESMTAPAPEPPVNVKAVPHGSRAVQVTWDASPSEGVEKYIVERTDADETNRFVRRSEQEEKIFHEGETPDTDLRDNETYLYRISSVNRVGAIGQPSAPVKVTTEPPPEPVKGLAAGSREVRCVPLSWQPNPEPDIVRYDILRKDSADGSFAKLASVKVGTTEYLDGGSDPGDLEDQHAYFYTVVAVDAVTAESKPCKTVSATTRAPPPAVEGVTAEFGRPREVPVSWTASVDEKVIGYEVLRAGPDGDQPSSIATVEGREATAYLDKGGAKPSALGRLADGSEYTYQVLAFNTARVKSEPSRTASAKTKFVPQAPVDLATTTNLPKSVKITWSPNAEIDVTEYVVESAPAGSERFRECARVPASQDAKISATESRLPDGGGRLYRIKAIDKDTLESPWSDTVEGATKPLPGAPTEVTAELNDQGARMTWTAAPQPDIKQYNIWRKGFLGSDLIMSSATTDCQLHPGEIGKKITVTVSAVDTDGLESPRSEPLEIRPPAPVQQ